MESCFDFKKGGFMKALKSIGAAVLAAALAFTVASCTQLQKARLQPFWTQRARLFIRTRRAFRLQWRHTEK